MGAKRDARTPGREGRDAADERPRGTVEELGTTWDQPQPRYPAPERPRDQADERRKRKRSA